MVLRHGCVSMVLMRDTMLGMVLLLAMCVWQLA